MTARVELQLTGSVDHLRIVWQTGEALLENVPFCEDPEGTRYNVLVAIQEMVTNVLRHGYHGDQSCPLHVAFRTDDARFEIEIRDRGERFNPLDYDLSCVLGETEMPTEAGGYGIMIATVVMDGIDYRFEDGWNRLTMTKLVEVAQTVGT
jgi:serine/threonine-protein kinase RsbW